MSGAETDGRLVPVSMVQVRRLSQNGARQGTAQGKPCPMSPWELSGFTLSCRTPRTGGEPRSRTERRRGPATAPWKRWTDTRLSRKETSPRRSITARSCAGTRASPQDTCHLVGLQTPDLTDSTPRFPVVHTFASKKRYPMFPFMHLNCDVTSVWV